MEPIEKKGAEVPNTIFPPFRGNLLRWSAFGLAIVVAGLGIWAINAKAEKDRAETSLSDSIEWYNTVSSFTAYNQSDFTLEQRAEVNQGDIDVANAMNGVGSSQKALADKSAQFSTAAVLAGVCAAGLLCLLVLIRVRTADANELQSETKRAALNTAGEEGTMTSAMEGAVTLIDTPAVPDK